MDYLKRAITSIKRRPGKAVILLSLVFVLGNIISGAISIQQAVSNTEDNLRRNLPAVATLEIDSEALHAHQMLTDEWPELETMTPDIIRAIGALPHVATYDFSVTAPLFSSELERFIDPNAEDIWDWESLPEVDDLVRFTVRGVHNPDMIDVSEGIIEMVAGRTFNEAEMGTRDHPNFVAIISKQLAEQNNLVVGSTFTLDNTIYDTWDVSGAWIESELFSEDNVVDRESYEFTVVGIFDIQTEVNTGSDWSDQEQTTQLQNRIYVPNAVAEAAMTFQFVVQQENFQSDWIDPDADAEDGFMYDPIFILNDPRDLVAFGEAANVILPDFWMVTDLSNTFGDIASSMEAMQMLATTVLVVAIIATLLILSLLITLFLRDRKHEIGIYLALGEQKLKIVSQILLEVMAVSIIAITLSLFSGSFLASHISETMLRNDLLAGQHENDFMHHTGGSLQWFSEGDLSMEEMLASYDLSLDIGVVMLFYGVGIGVILISTVAPIAYIMRLDPKKIMM